MLGDRVKSLNFWPQFPLPVSANNINIHLIGPLRGEAGQGGVWRTAGAQNSQLQADPKLCKGFRGTPKSQNNPEKEQPRRGFAISNTAQRSLAGRTDQQGWARSESPEVSPRLQPVGFCQEAEFIQRRRMISSADSPGTPGHPHARERAGPPQPTASARSEPDRGAGAETGTFAEEPERMSPHGLGCSGGFLGVTPKARVTPGDVDALGSAGTAVTAATRTPPAAPRLGRGQRALSSRLHGGGRGGCLRGVWLSQSVGRALLCAWQVTQ